MSRFENSYSPKPDRTGWLIGLLMVGMLVLIVWGVSAWKGCQDEAVRCKPVIRNSDGVTVHVPACDYDAWMLDHSDVHIVRVVTVDNGIHGVTSEFVITYQERGACSP